MKITVAYEGSPATDNDQYPRLIEDINKYTNMDVTWNRSGTAQLPMRYAANDVSDVMVVPTDAAFWSAAAGGSYEVEVEDLDAEGNPIMVDKLDADGNPELNEDGTHKQVVSTHVEVKTIADSIFWDITDYIDDYDNLSTIPQSIREAASYNGRMYGIPRYRTLARNGIGFRKDWCEKLNLAFWNKIEAGEDPTWQDFYDMLYAFTYNDPDGNGQNDTCGLYIDDWQGVLDIMMAWFGVPNEWGIDEKGDLIHKTQTQEYRTALKEIRRLYEDGLINNGSNTDAFWTIGGGGSHLGIEAGKGGASVQVLDFERKIETVFEKDGTNGATPDNPIYWLTGYVLTESGGNEPHVLPTSGFKDVLAISKKNIKTVEQLKRVLQFLNDLNDGECMNLIEYGWEGVTYELDENGYIRQWKQASENAENDQAKLDAAGVVSLDYNNNFNQVLCYFTAPENERPTTLAPPTELIRIREQELYDANMKYAVPNYGISYNTKTYRESGKMLDGILKGTLLNDDGKLANKSDRGLQWNYILGEIDDAGLEAGLKTWWEAGGEQWTKEMNEAYHAAGN